ncbi:MAG: 3-deoxy-manno-octulosonate cytidylyltransferase [Planctomycetota bacterium]
MTGPDPRATAIIPARLGSERFPRKVLASETGTPLIVHVCHAAARASLVERVVVGAGETEIVEAVEAAGFEARLTDAGHESGTSRVAEVADQLGLPLDALVVNVQGDEPEIEPGVIDAAIKALAASNAPVATVASEIRQDEDASNPNIVKVVTDRFGEALMFSRAPIPHDRDGKGAVRRLRHVGIYAYRRWFLRDLQGLQPTPLERAERLEQLRFMEHGHRIAVAEHASTGAGIDTPEQYRAFVQRFARDRDSHAVQQGHKG